MANVKNIIRKAAKAAPVRKFIALPIDKIEEQFTAAFAANDVVIINTPTGSGKTMRVPMWANKLSGKTSFCLVPRRKMAQSSANGAYMTTWVDSPMKNGPVEWTVGQDGKKASVLKNKAVVYCTEGAFLARKMENYSPGCTILVDEVHEQNTDTEITLLVASTQWAQQGNKIVLMSATMDIDRYKAYFEQKGLSVGFVKLEDDGTNRPYSLHKEIVEDPIKSVAERVAAGDRALIGVYGAQDKSNVEALLGNNLATLGSKAPIFYFHSRMEEEQWQEAMEYDGPCVYIATNILQSGHTIPNIQVGYFTNAGRRIESTNGVNRLTTYNLSKSEVLQWHGRLGRTEDGTVYMTQRQVDVFERQTFLPTAKIKLETMEDTMAKFLVRGFDIRKPENRLLNQPSTYSLSAAEKVLKSLGLYDNPSMLKAVMAKGNGVRNGFMMAMADLPSVGLSKTIRFLTEIINSNPVDRVEKQALMYLSGNFDVEKQNELLDIFNRIKAIMANLNGYDYATDTFKKMRNLSATEKKSLVEKRVFIKGLYMLNAKFLRIQAEYREVSTRWREAEGYLSVGETLKQVFKYAWADNTYRNINGTIYKVDTDGVSVATRRFLTNRSMMSLPDNCTFVAVPEDIELQTKVLYTLKTPVVIG